MTSKTNNKSNYSFLLMGLIGVAAVAGMVGATYLKLGDIHETQNARINTTTGTQSIDQKVIAMGQGWILKPESIASSHVNCIEEKYVAKAQREADDYNDSLRAKIYGQTKIPACIVKDGASGAEIQEQVVKVLGLEGNYRFGIIRNLDRGGFTKDSYVLKSVHVMIEKKTSHKV